MGILYAFSILSVALPMSLALSLIVLAKVPPRISVPIIKKSEPDIYFLTLKLRNIFPQKGDTVSNISGVRGGDLKGYKLLATSVGSVKMALLKRGGDVFVVREGEAFKGGFVKKIGKDFVIVDINGREEILKFPRDVGGRISDEKFVSITERPPSAGAVISRRELEKLTADPGIMFNQVRLVPYVKNGRTEGFVFEWIKPNSLLAKAGLRPGDVLIAINNMQITSGEDAFRILQLLRNENTFKISILRNGKQMDLTVRVE